MLALSPHCSHASARSVSSTATRTSARARSGGSCSTDSGGTLRATWCSTMAAPPLCLAVAAATARQKDPLLRPGDVCRFEGFVDAGCLRVFSASQHGADHVLYLRARRLVGGRHRELYLRLAGRARYRRARADHGVSHRPLGQRAALRGDSKVRTALPDHEPARARGPPAPLDRVDGPDRRAAVLRLRPPVSRCCTAAFRSTRSPRISASAPKLLSRIRRRRLAS